MDWGAVQGEQPLKGRVKVSGRIEVEDSTVVEAHGNGGSGRTLGREGEGLGCGLGVWVPQVGADARELAKDCSRILGWVSDFGTESELPTVPYVDAQRFIDESAKEH